MASQIDGPDFICIGMPRAGTDWLYDQVQFHPDFWMPPVKEIRYLLHEIPQLKHFNNNLRALNKNLRSSSKRQGDERDRLFLEWAMGLAGEPRDLKHYAGLFRYKRGLLSGDVSPGYCVLDEATIQALAAALPNTKIVLLVRDPVARAWSHLALWNKTGRFDSALLERPKKFQSFLEDRRRVERTWFVSETAKRWKNSAPDMPFQFFFFDDIVTDPDKAREQILGFIGADPRKPSADLPPGYNRKAQDVKLPLTEPIKEILVAHLADEIRACIEVFGGHSRQWAEQYGI